MNATTVAQEYELVEVGSIRPHPRNPRKGDVQAILESIDSNGFFGACVVQRSTGYVLAGNHRYKAAVEAGISEIPVIWLDVDDSKALRILLVDNRTNDVAGYSSAMLAEILAELSTASDLIGTGYDQEALDAIIADLSRDFMPATEPTASTKTYTEADLTGLDSGVNSGSKNMIEVLCPECGTSFYLDADNLRDKWKESQKQTASS